MNKHEATELSIRLIAILNLINLLSTLPYVLSIQDVANSNVAGVRNSWIAPLIIVDLLVSILLWFGANSIEQWIWRGSRENAQGASPTALQIQVILFSAVGLYLLVSVIPNMFEFFVYFSQEIAASSPSLSLSDYANAIGFLLRVLISVWLLFNSGGIVAALQRGRSASSKGETA